MYRLLISSLTAGLILLSTAQAETKEDRFAKVEIKTTKLTDNLYMLKGSGGNIGVSAGEDGIFMIDDQYAPLTDKILKALKEISDQPVRFIINTHWHFDHTGGNENLGKKDAVIVAHDNVYKRMSTEQFITAFDRHYDPSPKVALPVISFNDKVTFHLNGLNIKARHYPHAHTDGDSVILFKKNNVVHMGDIFFNKTYPFVDSSSGGSIYGMIAAVADILSMVDEETKIVPGHGPLANKADLQDYHDMLVQVVALLEPLAKEGMSADEAMAFDPLKPLNEKWAQGWMKADPMIKNVYPAILKHVK